MSREQVTPEHGKLLRRLVKLRREKFQADAAVEESRQTPGAKRSPAVWIAAQRASTAFYVAAMELAKPPPTARRARPR